MGCLRPQPQSPLPPGLGSARLAAAVCSLHNQTPRCLQEARNIGEAARPALFCHMKGGFPKSANAVDTALHTQACAELCVTETVSVNVRAHDCCNRPSWISCLAIKQALEADCRWQNLSGLSPGFGLMMSSTARLSTLMSARSCTFQCSTRLLKQSTAPCTWVLLTMKPPGVYLRGTMNLHYK